MNELIKVNEKGLVSARELHEFLEVKTRFSSWIEQYTREENKYGFEKDVDFTTVATTTLVNNGAVRELEDFALTLETSKEISMLTGTKKGKDARKYFINCEKKLKQKNNSNFPEIFNAELSLLKFSMSTLNLSDSGKISMIGNFGKVHNMDTSYLPTYSEEKIIKPLSELLKQFNVNMSAISFNKTLLQKGIIKEMERNSSKGTVKKFKSIVDLEYGKNLVNSKNPKETQPHYYEDKFQELIYIVTSAKEVSEYVK
jgi:phage anti-repressor protein